MSSSPDNPFGVTPFMYGLARLIFRLIGWKIEGRVPNPPRCVLISAPHTSNWDGILLVIAAYMFKVRLSFYVKKELFVFPFGPVIRYFGGIPIDRSKRKNMVQQAIEDFERTPNLILAVPPEGTRHKTDYWKTGFYYIAHGAKVPLLLGTIDYGRKTCVLGPIFTPTGDIEADFQVFRDYYAGITPRYPQNVGKIELPPKRETPSVESSVTSGTPGEPPRA